MRTYLSNNLKTISRSTNPERACIKACTMVINHYESGRLSIDETALMLKACLINSQKQVKTSIVTRTLTRKIGNYLAAPLASLLVILLALFALATINTNGVMVQNLELPILVLSVVANILLGAKVYFKNYKSLTNKLFFTSTLLLSCFIIINYIALYPFWLSRLEWIRLELVSSALLFMTVYFLLFFYQKPELKRLDGVSWLVLICSLVSAVLALTPLVFSSAFMDGSAMIPRPGWGMVFFSIAHFFIIVSIALTIYGKYKASNKQHRQRLMIITVGVVLTFLSIFVFNFVLVQSLHTTRFIYLTNVATLIFTISFSYCALVQKMFDLPARKLKKIPEVLWVTMIAQPEKSDQEMY